MRLDSGWRLDDYDYHLPQRLIAQTPPTRRDGGRLWSVTTQQHCPFSHLPKFVRAGDLLVLNNSRVLPGRLFGVKASGGRVEILLERFLDSHTALTQARASKPLRRGARLHSEAGDFLIGARQGDFYELTAVNSRGQPVNIKRRFARGGRVPLPPYIAREHTAADARRYQTVFARAYGSVAAPTAGLHFTRRLLDAARHRGARIAHITLHIGAGTFAPIRADIAAHTMHRESYQISRAAAAAIAACRRRGGRVIAVGTTVLRALESAAIVGGGEVVPAAAHTDIFIKPGFVFRAADVLVTNFHQPRSTLLLLVCAFGGYDRVMSAYRAAVRQNLRFLSYGDAMLIERD